MSFPCVSTGAIPGISFGSWNPGSDADRFVGWLDGAFHSVVPPVQPGILLVSIGWVTPAGRICGIWWTYRCPTSKFCGWVIDFCVVVGVSVIVYSRSMFRSFLA